MTTCAGCYRPIDLDDLDDPAAPKYAVIPMEDGPARGHPPLEWFDSARCLDRWAQREIQREAAQ